MNTTTRIAILALISFTSPFLQGQDLKTIKKTYTPVVSDGMSEKSLAFYSFTHADRWLLTENGKSGKDLKFKGGSLPVADQRQPQELMLIPSTDNTGSFAMAFDFFQKGRDFSLRDVCVIFGYQNDSTYFYAQAASEMSRYSHNIFKLANGQTHKIGKNLTPAVIWNYEKWHHIVVIRDIDSHSIQLFIDNTPILQSDADEATLGQIGIGTYGSEFKIDNLEVWTPK